MCRRQHVLVLALGVAVLEAAGFGAAPRWTRVTSANFTLVGDAAERDIRKVAVQLEQFRDTIRRLLPAAPIPERDPTLVFVFADDRSYRPYKPLYLGKPVDVAGHFFRAADAGFISLSTQRGEEAFPVIYHEYTHLVVNRAVRSLPTWADEGLAEFYSTFRLSANGRQAYLGNPIERHVVLLRSRMLPLSDILSVDRTSPLYNERDRRTVFYAQSWAWVHFLLMVDPPRSREFLALLDALAAGKPRDEAFRSAFGGDPETLDAQLREYVHRDAFRSVVVTFTDKMTNGGEMKTAAMTEAEAEASQGDLLIQMNRLDEAERRLAAARQREPELAQAHMALGVLRVRQERPDEAVASFERALAIDERGMAGQRARTWLELIGRGSSRRTDPAARAATGVSRVESDVPAMTPVLRTVNDGEQRAEGMLERIECGPGGIVLLVNVGGRTLRFTAKRFDEIEFITYRDDLKGEVSCGPRDRPDHVYVTWRRYDVPAGSTPPPGEGQAAAVEFLPKRSGDTRD